MEYKKNFYYLNTETKNQKTKDENPEYKYIDYCQDLIDLHKPKSFCDVGFDLGYRLMELSELNEEVSFYGFEFDNLALTYSKNFFNFKNNVRELKILPDLESMKTLDVRYDMVYFGHWLNFYTTEEKQKILKLLPTSSYKYLIVEGMKKEELVDTFLDMEIVEMGSYCVLTEKPVIKKPNKKDGELHVDKTDIVEFE